jgi:hypothetical protein
MLRNDPDVLRPSVQSLKLQLQCEKLNPRNMAIHPFFGRGHIDKGRR